MGWPIVPLQFVAAVTFALTNSWFNYGMQIFYFEIFFVIACFAGFWIGGTVFIMGIVCFCIKIVLFFCGVALRPFGFFTGFIPQSWWYLKTNVTENIQNYTTGEEFIRPFANIFETQNEVGNRIEKPKELNPLMSILFALATTIRNFYP